MLLHFLMIVIMYIQHIITDQIDAIIKPAEKYEKSD